MTPCPLPDSLPHPRKEQFPKERAVEDSVEEAVAVEEEVASASEAVAEAEERSDSSVAMAIVGLRGDIRVAMSGIASGTR